MCGGGELTNPGRFLRAWQRLLRSTGEGDSVTSSLGVFSLGNRVIMKCLIKVENASIAAGLGRGVEM